MSSEPSPLPSPGVPGEGERGDATIYVHLYKDAISESVKLKPLAAMPKRATLLNDGRPVECTVELLPSEHVDHTPVLRLRKLPVNEMANTVLVVKLEFDDRR